MSAAPIKVGFIGLSATGWAADSLGPSLISPPVKGKYDLVAVSTTSDATAKACADKYSAIVGHPINAYSGSSANIANDPNVDLVVISVNGRWHKDVVLPVINSKKSFFLEYPAGGSLANSTEIAEAAKRNGVRLSPVVHKVKELLKNGAIGRVHSSVYVGLAPREIPYWPPFIPENLAYVLEKESRISVLALPAGHQLDTLMHVLGDFASISATGKSIYPIATLVDKDGKPTGVTHSAIWPDHFNISGVLTSGAIVSVVWQAGYKAVKGRRNLLWEINGEEGSIRIEGDSPFANIAHPTLYLKGEKVEVPGTDGGLLTTLENAWLEYAKGDQGTHATIEDVVKLHRVIDAVEQSIDQGGKTIIL